MFGPCRFFAVNLLPQWEEVIAELGSIPRHVFELHGGDPVWLVLRLYREFIAADLAADACVQALVYELCAHVSARAAEHVEPGWLAHLDSAVNERFREALDIAGLSQDAGVHPAHACQTFRRFRGHTISDAILRARVQYVARRLIESDEPLEGIASAAGFSDQSHMTRVFKRIPGKPPGEHRDQYAKSQPKFSV